MQVEKENFFEHMSVLSAGYKSVLQLTQRLDLTPMQSAAQIEKGYIKSI